MTEEIEFPRPAATPTASTKSGNAMIVSITRPMMRSGQPPAQPAKAPRAVPSVRAISTAATAMIRSSRVATSTRLRMSRPYASVPKACERLGAVNASSGAGASGS